MCYSYFVKQLDFLKQNVPIKTLCTLIEYICIDRIKYEMCEMEYKQNLNFTIKLIKATLPSHFNQIYLTICVNNFERTPKCCKLQLGCNTWNLSNVRQNVVNYNLVVILEICLFIFVTNKNYRFNWTADVANHLTLSEMEVNIMNE